MFTLERVGKGDGYQFKSLPAPAPLALAQEDEAGADEEDELQVDTKAASIIVGSRIEAKFDDGDEFYPGTVTRVNSSKGPRGGEQSSPSPTAAATCTVRFDDGDIDSAVPLSDMRVLRGSTSTRKRKVSSKQSQPPRTSSTEESKKQKHK